MADIFISYSSEDKTIVKQIAGLLENKGWSVWWDRQIPIGQSFDNVIENELHNASCVLVIWTQKSVSSEWVKNEASEAARKGVLVPVVLEKVALPLAFKRTESAMLVGWNGEQDNPELELLFNAIKNILANKKDSTAQSGTSVSSTASRSTIPKHSDTSESNDSRPKQGISLSGYSVIGIIGFILSLFLVYYYLNKIQGKVSEEVDQRMFYLILILFGISASALIFGVMNTYAVLKGEKQNIQLKMAGPGVGVILVVLGGLFLPPKAVEKSVTIRLFDWKKNPVTQGDVKIYLREYIRTQSIDKMGQALFTGLPSDIVNSKLKIEVSSPGYATKNFDTLFVNSKPLELTLPLTAVVLISGKVKTAAEIPISGVEINVDGTRYYAMSITDGSYSLRLEEYTLGDEITLTTSHKDYEDKTISLRINSPEIRNQDIFLNPIKH
jgi:hypothetical protein